MSDAALHGTVHRAAPDLLAALGEDPAVLAQWTALTPLARNEFVCWVDDAKRAATRARRIARAVDELREGKRRPCCWPGCVHRTDKAPGAWQQAVLVEGKRR